jgi:hypothetical protein
MDELGFDTRAQAQANPEKELRRWLLEVKLALKREKEWRLTGNSVIKKYRGQSTKKNSFNILWANTDVLRPALYNSTPKPDVRRRFRQNDILGRAVGEVSERSITYCVDAYDMDNCMKADVLDALLPGRGLSRVRYVPTIKQAPLEQPAQPQAQGQTTAPSVDSEGVPEAVEYEQALCDHVQWDDYIQGPGKTWDEVTWVGFRHRLTKDDQVEKFGEDIAKQVSQGTTSEPEVEGEQNKDIAGVFKRAEFWEIWDKDSKRVFYVNESYRKGLIFTKENAQGEPPLKLKEFFPIPRPLMLVEDSGSLIPIPLYELYKEQAEELDRLSTRINKIVNACRVRFVHDPTLTELKTLMDADDNIGVPAEQARAWMTNGGLEKAIWWMPVHQIATVLRELYVARDSAKQVIYEITGISDILRGATDPRETLGAQQLKANSSSLRLAEDATRGPALCARSHPATGRGHWGELQPGDPIADDRAPVPDHAAEAAGAAPGSSPTAATTAAGPATASPAGYADARDAYLGGRNRGPALGHAALLPRGRGDRLNRCRDLAAGHGGAERGCRWAGRVLGRRSWAGAIRGFVHGCGQGHQHDDCAPRKAGA